MLQLKLDCDKLIKQQPLWELSEVPGRLGLQAERTSANKTDDLDD